MSPLKPRLVKKTSNLFFNSDNLFVKLLSMNFFMNPHRVFHLFLGCLFASALSAQGGKKFELSGQLTGFTDSAQVRLFKSGENTPFATTILLNNQFVLKGELAEPLLAFLFVGDQQEPAELFL